MGSAAGIQAGEFDAASIKPTRSGGGPSGPMGAGNGRAGGRNVTLKALIAVAWQLQDFQIVSGPAWSGSDRFDVEGKSEDPKANPNRLRLMLQSLLADRPRTELAGAT